MTVELIPKKEEKKPLNVFVFLFFLTLILFLVSVSAYFILGRLRAESAKILAETENLISQKETPERKALEKEVLEEQKKIKDAAPLLEEHKFNSRFFAFLEKITHPQVFFGKMNLNSRDFQANLSGQAENFNVLSQQFFIFEEEDLLGDIILSGVSINKEGKIEFVVKFSFEPQIIKY